MVISVSDYRKLIKQTKLITLREGIEFEIKQISALKFLEMQSLQGENKMAEQVKAILLNGVVDPPLSDKPEEGKVFVEDIPADDMAVLVNEITKFSKKIEEGGSARSFLSEEEKPSI
jgi:hypothetical protein